MAGYQINIIMKQPNVLIIMTDHQLTNLSENPDYASINPYITVVLTPIGPGG